MFDDKYLSAFCARASACFMGLVNYRIVYVCVLMSWDRVVHLVCSECVVVKVLWFWNRMECEGGAVVGFSFFGIGFWNMKVWVERGWFCVGLVLN